ncbi:hypothetical protein ACJX0J_015573, partial [Zea mays]
ASDKCVKERRKTINDNDIIWSLGTLGFEEYVEPLKIYLNNYRENGSKHTKETSFGMVPKTKTKKKKGFYHESSVCRHCMVTVCGCHIKRSQH